MSSRDFYSLSAYFRNTVQSPLDGNILDTPPVVRVPPVRDRPRLSEIERETTQLDEALAANRGGAGPKLDAWLATLDPASLEHPLSKELLLLHLPLKEGEGFPVAGTGPDGQPIEVALTEGLRWTDGAPAGSAIEFTGSDGLTIGDFGDIDPTQPFSFGAWVRSSDRTAFAAVFARMDEDNRSRGWDLSIQDNGTRPVVHLVRAWPRRAIKAVARDPVLKPGQWSHLFVTFDGSGKAAGLQIYVDGNPVPLQVENDSLEGSPSAATPFRIGARSRGLPFTGGGVQDLRVYRTQLSREDIQNIRFAAPVARALGSPASPESRDILTNYYLETQDPAHSSLASRKVALEAERSAIHARSPVTHIMQDRSDAEALAHVLHRGQYDQRREEVRPGVPEALHALPPDSPPNRLGLAHWINSPDNPLTARVTVNRMWQEIFGTGLVATAGDFGIMGDHPSHPDLLDWLAVEFRESGWDTKHMLHLILSSNTYRQSPLLTAAKLERDPANRLLARGPRFRLDAEMLRDYALAASGLLSTRIGGPSVKPYQPPGVWEVVAMPESNTRNYQADRGEDLYRRSLYTFWKRAAPPASMEILNAPSRETCTVRRERTNTPLQALLTMNDPQLIEAARALVQSVLPVQSGSRDRLQTLAVHVLARPLRAEELAVLEPSFEEFQAYYREHPAEASQLVAVGELPLHPALDPGETAAWIMIANQLLNLDEALNK